MADTTISDEVNEWEATRGREDELVGFACAFVEKAREIAPGYAKATIRELKKWSFKNLDNAFEFDQGSITLNSTVNTSCHCHPDYITAGVSIPHDVVFKALRGEDWLTPAMITFQKEKEAHEQRELVKEQEDKRRREEDTRKRELEQLERLSAKYPKSSIK